MFSFSRKADAEDDHPHHLSEDEQHDKRRTENVRLRLHFHNTRGMGLANVLALGKSTAVVEPMLRVMLESKVPGSARQWLDANTAFAIPGLLPLVTAQGAKAEAAASYLRELARAGHADAIDAALGGMDEQVARAVRTKVLSAHEE